MVSNANEILFRSSGAGLLMTNPRDKSQMLADTVITHLVNTFVSARYGRREERTNKFLTKGNEREEHSITLLSLAVRRMFKKNTVRLSNEFITGEWDLHIGDTIEKPEDVITGSIKETIDTKTSWSAHTFFRAISQTLDPLYWWQGQCYMWLTGAKKHTVAFCLVNGTARVIQDEKFIASRKPGMMDEHGNETEKYIEACKQIEINHIFDIKEFLQELEQNQIFFEFHNDVDNWQWDIPAKDRVHLFEVNRDDSAIELLRGRIRLCRNWMNRELFKI